MKKTQKYAFAMTAIASVVSIAMLGGCASTEVTTKIEKDYASAAAKLASAKDSLSNRPIILPESPYPYLGKKSSQLTESTEELPRIIRDKGVVKFKQKALTADEFGRLITEETGVPVKVLVDSKNNQIVNVDGKNTLKKVEVSTLPPMPVRQLLSTVAPQFGLDWDYYDGAIHLESSFRKNYQISFSPSSSRSKLNLGKTSNSQTGAGAGNNGMSGNFSSAMESTIEGDLKPIDDFKSTLAAIAGSPDNVYINASVGLASVNCSKDCHNAVKKFIDQANFLLTQQVLLRVNEITVSSTAQGQSGVDWNLVYQQAMASGKGYSLIFGSPASVVSNTAGAITTNIVTPAGKLPDHFDGSKLLFKAISQASKVIENKPYDLIAQQNESVTLSNMDQKAYVESTSVVPTGVGGTPVYSQKLGYATYGQLIQITPTILPSGKINIRFGIDDTKIKNLVLASAQGDTDKLTLGGLKFTTKATLRVGSTLILSGFKVTQSNTDNNGLFAGQRVGSSAGTDTVTETIILITPFLTGV